jgi:hypothetical protein
MGNEQSKTYERVIEVDSDAIRSMIAEKVALAEEGQAYQREAEELEKQHKAIVEKMHDVADKIRTLQVERIMPEVRTLVEDKLTAYEIPTTTEIRDGKTVVVVHDLVELYKERFSDWNKWETPLPGMKKKEEEPKE